MKQKSSDTKDRVRNCKSHQVAVLERKNRQIGREEIFQEVIEEIPPQTEEMQECWDWWAPQEISMTVAQYLQSSGWKSLGTYNFIWSLTIQYYKAIMHCEGKIKIFPGTKEANHLRPIDTL